MKRKKYSLKKTWELCLAMWKWIAKEWPKNDRSVTSLKLDWLKQNGFENANVSCSCFFCDYMFSHPRKNFVSPEKDCAGCPGKEVAPRFNCSYSGWDTDPVKFYRILKRMYAKWKKLH